MRLAIIAPNQDLPSFENAANRTNGHFDLGPTTNDLPSTKGVDSLLNRQDEFDAVVMLSPNSVSPRQLKQLAGAGKHLLLAATNTDIGTLEETSRLWQAAGALCMAAQPRRFTAYATVLQQDAKLLGDPGLVRIHHWLDATEAETDSRDALLWAKTVGEIDLTCGLFSAAPQTVYASPINVELPRSGILIHLGFESGMALIDCAYHSGPAFYAASFIGSQGAAYADDHHNTNLLMAGNAQGIRVTDDESWLRLQLEHFVKTIRSEQTNTSVMDMIRAIQVSHAAIQAADAGAVAAWTGAQYELQA